MYIAIGHLEFRFSNTRSLLRSLTTEVNPYIATTVKPKASVPDQGCNSLEAFAVREVLV